jgi:outer membrane biosynthesis protein TonB
MTHLQKKCLVGSVCLHGLAVAVVLGTAAFRSAPVITEEQVLTLIPATVLDRPGVGGEPPPIAVKPQPSQPSRPQPQPSQATPPKPPSQPAPAATPKTVVTTPPRQPDTKSAPSRTTAAPAPARRSGIKVDLTQTAPASRGPSSNNDSASQARTAAQEATNKLIQQEVAEAFAALGSSVQSKASPVSVAALPGEGGGEAFVNYRTAVFNAYYQAWKTPEGTTRKLAVADVRIVVGRDGTILSSEFVSKSGDAVVDQSVQRALDQVERQKLPPFPAGAVDTQRPFIIRFNLEARQSAG